MKKALSLVMALVMVLCMVSLAGAEGGGADVEGVGAVVDGLAAELQVLGGGEQFEFHTRINEDSSFLLQ